jgi:hypothetical protein
MTEQGELPLAVRAFVRFVDVCFTAMAALTVLMLGLMLISAALLEILYPTLSGLVLIAVDCGLLYTAIKLWPIFTKATKL